MTTIRFLYSTETGNSEDVAYILYNEFKQKFISVQNEKLTFFLTDLKDYNYEEDLPNEENLIFVVSTTGDGNIPLTMKNFWNYLLRKSLPSNHLFNHSKQKFINYSVFGLGDNSYTNYNTTSKKLYVRLKQLGGIPLLTLGLGNDQDLYGYDTALDKWKILLEESMSKDSNLMKFYYKNQENYEDNKIFNIKQEDIYSIEYTIIEENSSDLKSNLSLYSEWLDPLVYKNSFEAEVEENFRLSHTNYEQDIRHLRFKLSKEMNYSPGDVIKVYYQNNEQLIDRACNLLNKKIVSSSSVLLEKDSILSINIKKNPIRLTRLSTSINKITIYQLFLLVLDIGSIPKKSFFSLLSNYATDNEEKEKLIEISSNLGTDIYYDYCVKAKRNYIEVLEEFRSVVLPIESLLEIVPLVAPRSYSIASSSINDPTRLELCVGVNFYKPRNRKVYGLCSSFLSNLNKNNKILITYQEGLVKKSPILPTLELNNTQPLLLIATGTGIAPVRSIIQHVFYNNYEKFYDQKLVENEHDNIIENKNSNEFSSFFLNSLKKIESKSVSSTEDNLELVNKKSNTFNITKINLFFGCRYPDKDNTYHKEWSELKEYTNQFQFFNYFPAYSQIGLQKTYVTHLIKQNSELIWNIISNNGVIFLCGSSKRMPADVTSALSSCCVKHGDMTEEEAKKLLSILINKKIFIIESW